MSEEYPGTAKSRLSSAPDLWGTPSASSPPTTYLLGELSNLYVYVTTVEETHFTCAEDCRVLSDDFKVVLAFGNRCSARVSRLVGHSLNVIVNLFVGDEGRLVVADVAFKSFEFRVVTVYAPNSVGERRSFFWRLEPFFDDLKRIILVGDWNAIFDPKIDKAE